MKVNPRVFGSIDMFELPSLPNCPTPIRATAERILRLLTEPGFSLPRYKNVSELDKYLNYYLWQNYDGLLAGFEGASPFKKVSDFRDWYITCATPEDLTSRARRWLIEKSYCYLDTEIQQRANEASSRYSRAIGNRMD